MHVVKTEDGTEQTYTVPADDDAPGSSDTVETFSVWEWEVTFVTKAGDMPLMAAVWWDGRTLPGQDDDFEDSGRAARLTCGTCAAFGSASWSSDAEAIVGLRMEVHKCKRRVWYISVQCSRAIGILRGMQSLKTDFFQGLTIVFEFRTPSLCNSSTGCSLWF